MPLRSFVNTRSSADGQSWSRSGVVIVNVFSVWRGLVSRVVAVGVTGVLVAGSVVFGVGAAHATTADFTVEGITYSVVTGPGPETVTVVSYDAHDVQGLKVVIPDTIDNPDTDPIVEAYPVTAIGDDAFFDIDLRSVVIGDNVTSIGEEAFIQIGGPYGGEPEVMLVSFGDSVTSIGYSAFAGRNLPEVDFPAGLTSIGGFAFQGANLLSVVVPDSVTYIGPGAFHGGVLVAVNFLGEAPEGHDPAGQSVSGDAFYLGDDHAAGGSPVRVWYSAAFGSSVVGEGGFTTPYWYGHRAIPADWLVSFDMGGHGYVINQYPAKTDCSCGGWPDSLTDVTQVTMPTAPVAEGWIFDGWYTDGAFGTAFVFDTAPTVDTTVFAKWTAVDPVASFDLGGHGSAVAVQNLTAGDVVTEPTVPVAEGWIFDGWYTTDTFVTVFDFTAVPTVDTTVFAKWTAVVVTPEPAAPAPVLTSDDPAGWLAENNVPVQDPDAAGLPAAGVDKTQEQTATMGWSGDLGDKFVDVYAYSTPLFVGTFPVVDGKVQIVLSPAMLSALADGTHTLVVTGQTSGAVQAVSFRIVDTLAATGFDRAPLGSAGLLLLLAGAALLLRRRGSVA
jgi:uncharacterized repeat protein (TIGR02543 family)